MEDSSRWLSATMILWLPVIYLTTYLGFFEAYELAKSNELFSLDYPENYPVFLILPAMIPTMFTAYTVINRKRMMFNLITKFNTFHEQAESGKTVTTSTYLTDSEFEKLPIEEKYQYCVDLNITGEKIRSTQLRTILFSKYKESKIPRLKAIAYMARSGMKSQDISYRDEFENSKIAYELIKDQPKDKLYFDILFDYVVNSVVLGYKESLELVEQIDSEISEDFEYWKLRIHIRKLYLHFYMNQDLVVDFDKIESKMNLHKYSHDELIGLETSFSTLRELILMKQDKLDELEISIKNRIYLDKWTGRGQANRRNGLGRLYRRQGRFDKALEMFNLNLSEHIQDNDINRQCIAMINIGKTNYAMKKYEKALEICKNSYELSESREFPRAVIESLTIIVNSLEKLGMEHQEERSELDDLVKLHGIKADPD